MTNRLRRLELATSAIVFSVLLAVAFTAPAFTINFQKFKEEL